MRTVVVTAEQLTPLGQDNPIRIASFTISDDGSRILIFTNTRRVWRSNSKGDYYVFDQETKTLKQLGTSLPSASLMFAKFSPDQRSVAYVSGVQSLS